MYHMSFRFIPSFDLHFKIKTSDKIFRRFDLAEIIFKFEKNE